MWGNPHMEDNAGPKYKIHKNYVTMPLILRYLIHKLQLRIQLEHAAAQYIYIRIEDQPTQTFSTFLLLVTFEVNAVDSAAIFSSAIWVPLQGFEPLLRSPRPPLPIQFHSHLRS